MQGRATRTGSRRPAVLLVTVSLTLAGCAGYQLEPLSASHPAHPEATAASEPPVSQTLAYTRSDIPSVQPVSPVTAVPHEGHGTRPMAGATPTVVGEGEVIATAPNTSQIVVDHGEIEGFMEAMTMGYQVDPTSLLAGLKQGDRVRFTIDVRRRAIVQIEKLP